MDTPKVTSDDSRTAAQGDGDSGEARHSPLPWSINPNELRSACVIDGERGFNVAECWHGVGRGDGTANAEFIVRACNAHYPLVAACRQMKDQSREMMALLGALTDQMAEFIPDIPMTEAERNQTNEMIAAIRARVKAAALAESGRPLD